MSVRCRCSSCKSEFSVDDKYAGKKARCPKCGTDIEVRAVKTNRPLKVAKPLEQTEQATKPAGPSVSSEFSIDLTAELQPRRPTRHARSRATTPRAWLIGGGASGVVLLVLIVILVVARSKDAQEDRGTTVTNNNADRGTTSSHESNGRQVDDSTADTDASQPAARKDTPEEGPNQREAAEEQLVANRYPPGLYDWQHQLKSLEFSSEIDLSELSWLESQSMEHLLLRSGRGQSINGVERVAGLKSLESLVLGLSGNHGRSDLMILAKCKQLKQLTLTLGASGKPSDLAPLANLPQLERLRLRLFQSEVSDLTPLKELQQLEHLDLELSLSAIRDLKPLEKLTRLTQLTLDLRGTSVVDLTPLAKLTKLKHLTLHLNDDNFIDRPDFRNRGGDGPATTHSRVSGLKPLEHLRQLEQLTLTIPGRAIDYPLLAELPKLRQLSLHPSSAELNGLKLLDQLEQLTLDLGYQQVNNLSGLDEATLLRQLTLNIEGTEVSDLAPLTKLAQLEQLTLQLGLKSSIEDLTPLSKLGQLKRLTLSLATSSKISELASLSKLPRLSELTLDLYRTHVSGLTHVAKLPQLSELNLRLLGVGDGDLAFLEQMPVSILRTLELHGSYLNNLRSLEKLTQLKRLSLSFGQEFKGLADLTPLSRLSELEELTLYLDGTEVGDLASLAGLTKLKKLTLCLDYSQVRDLSALEALPALTELRIVPSLGKLPIASLQSIPKTLTRLTIRSLTTPSSNSAEDIEGTWHSLAQTVDGQSLPEGLLVVEFGKDNGLVLTLAGNRFTGEYSLRPGDYVVFDLEQEIDGFRGFNIAVDGEELTLTDRGGSPTRFRRVDRKTSLVNDKENIPPAPNKMPVVWCPPGEFKMGSPETEVLRRANEEQVDVVLTRGFWVGAYEVTQAQFEFVTGHNPSENTGATLPVDNVTLKEAAAFCKKLTDLMSESGDIKEGWEYRVPTEAQWEYACRAGTTTAYSFGEDASQLGHYAQYNPFGRIKLRAVGLKKPNAWGLYDIHGNVAEWCRDVYQEKLPGGTDPEATGAGQTLVMRGGVLQDAESCRSAYRREVNGQSGLGFRVVLVQSNGQARIANKAAHWVFERGGRLKLNSPQSHDIQSAKQLPGTSLKIVDINLASADVTDADLAKIVGLPDLKVLDLSGTRVTSAGLVHLRSLDELLLLKLAGTRVTDLSQLGEMKQLRYLNLVGTRVTGDQLKVVGSLPDLRRLHLKQTSLISDDLMHVANLSKLSHLCLDQTGIDNVEHLTGLRGLKELSLSDAPISDDGIASLGTLQNLKELTMERVQISDAGLEQIGRLSHLEKLKVSSPKMTDVGVKQLGRLKELSELAVTSELLTDAALDEIKNLPNLKQLSIGSTSISDEAIKRFKTEHADCTVKRIDPLLPRNN